MNRNKLSALICVPLSLACALAAIPVDLSGLRPGPISVKSSGESLVIAWPDENGKPWTAEFSLDPKKPLLAAIAVNGAKVLDRASPFYAVSSGKRRGGWDQFFDFPPSHPEGTRSFLGRFELRSARASSTGNRVEVSFDGIDLGIFKGAICYRFYPGSRLIEQAAVISTNEPDTAYIYTAGLRTTVDADRRAGGNMDSKVTFFDTSGALRTVQSDGPDDHPERVRYRAIAARTGAGSISVFPAPHQFFFPRDFTTNQGYVWHTTWRGVVSLGIRQLPDDDWIFYPWVNAPPGTRQQLRMFVLVTDRDPRSALDDTLRFTHNDRFPELPGYQTFTSHWHFAYTVQAMEHGLSWTPPFKRVLADMGVHGAMIMDFHGDGHPNDLGRTRLDELAAFYGAARAQSDDSFLIIPSEEANVYFGGHWALAFPKPVYWFMGRPDGAPFQSADPKLGTVYHVGNKEDLLALVRKENAFAYQTHPRTKGSTGFPDRIKDEAYFRDPHYFGAGWKALPSDLSSPRLGDRAFKVLDDMNNWGLKKRLIGEVDVFQIDPTHELYGHMNGNYVRLPRLPAFDRYGELLDALRKGDFFMTTGEVLLPESAITAGPGDSIRVRATVDHTFPLQMGEVVWGDGTTTHRQEFSLAETGSFKKDAMDWTVDAKGWRWVRFAVWDIAANGAFVNPLWRN